MGSTGWRRRSGLVVVALGLVAVSCSSDDEPEPAASEESGESGEIGDQPISLEVVSSRPEYATGGDALVAVEVGDGLDPVEAEITINGDPVELQVDAEDSQRLVGLVSLGPDAPRSGTMAPGDTEVVARIEDHEDSVTITNNPLQGPLFSGPHLPLAACTTHVFGLAPSTLEDDCVAPSQVSWRYVDTAGQIKVLAEPSAPPPDAETVTTVDGRSVPFVIRTETGVLNRAVYRIDMLDPAPSPADPLGQIDTGAWNQRLIYRFGGGCGASFTQGFDWAGDPALALLRQGYAAATATFNTFQVLCNDVLSAETVSMVKERFVEGYGEPDFTIGEGGSGGAIQQILLAQNYPGLLDGIAPSLPFPDALSIGGGVYDCALLTRYYAGPAGSQLTPEQRTAVNGHAVPGTCGLWNASFAQTIDPAAGCRLNIAEVFAGSGQAPVPVIPDADIYHPQGNPDGWRCTVWETNVAITGRDPETGFARSGYDNQGIQYGLDALNAGVLTPDQFVDLNAGIGGYDRDGQPQAERSVVPEDLVARAYATGRVSGPEGGLPDTPMILTNVYTDEVGDIHDRVRAFSLLDRLSGEEGGEWPATMSLRTVGVAAGAGLMDTLGGALGDLSLEPTLALDEWLTAATEHQEQEGGSWAEALAAAKPESAESRCLVDGQPPIVGPEANDDPACAAAYPVHEEPRMAAGGPRSGAVLKCQLIPVDEADDVYEVELSDDQLDRLTEIFPDGVCDWSQPSVGQTALDGTWQSFGTEEP